MKVFWKLLVANFKHFGRERAALFFTFFFPVMFMLIFGLVFGGDGSADGVPVYPISRPDLETGLSAVQLFADTGLATSRSEAKRLVKQGGAFINGETVPDIEFRVTASLLDDQDSLMLRAGKKRYVRVTLLP